MKLAAYIAVAAFAAVGAFPGLQHGVSGDASEGANVLVLQQVAAQTLAEKQPPPSSASDINGDGVVNLLDYQKLVYATVVGEKAEDENPPPACPSDAVPAVRTAEKLSSRPIAFLACLALPAQKTASFQLERQKSLATPQLLQNLFSLYPHAPPR